MPLVTALATVAALALVLPAQGVDAVGGSLREDPVYVDPEAELALSDREADDLRDRIWDTGAAVFVAVLPGSMAPSDEAATALPRELAAATGLAGNYAVVVGDRFRATSGQAATSALNEARDDGVAAVLARYVDLVAGGRPSGGSGSGGGDGGGSDGGGSMVPLALLASAGVGLYALAKRRRRREEAAERRELEADVQLLRAELSVLSEDVLRLEPEVTLHPDARQDYDAATQRVRAASAALDYADEPVDLVRVERVVTEARYAMSRARAIVAGHEPPPPPAELQRPGRHDEPPVDVDEWGRPVYVGGATFYGGGWFGGGGLFSGLLLGSMLGGFGGWGWGGHHHHDVGGGDAGGGDWGDVGGGDWGGGGWGDVGGGDF